MQREMFHDRKFTTALEAAGADDGAKDAGGGLGDLGGGKDTGGDLGLGDLGGGDIPIHRQQTPVQAQTLVGPVVILVVLVETLVAEMIHC